MRTPLVLLKFVAKALGNALGGGFAGDLLIEVLPEVAKDAWEWWSKDRTTEQCRAEVEAIAQAGVEEVRQQVAEIVQEVIADKPLEVRQAVETYLTEVPASIRRSLRRASDPTGTTIPADLVPKNAYDLLRLLPSRMPRFKPGSHPLFGVDWELEQLLGVGGFGEVWKARNPLYPSVEPVALKFCLDPAAAKVLKNEAAVLDRVLREGKHPGIVQLLRTYLSAEIPCLEYEYVEGGDLAGVIQEWHRAKGGPTPNQAAKVILRLAEIVGFAHKLNPPIVHRDLKPANILVQRTAADETLFKVADFGIGGVAVGKAIRETSRGTSRGKFLTSAVHGSYTPLYASPQQMRGDPPDPRDDVYSLGVIWYQLLTGDLANGRPGGSRWRKKLSDQGMPSEMAERLECCFEETPDDRPSDAATLAAELGRLLTTEAPSALPSSEQVVAISLTHTGETVLTSGGQEVTQLKHEKAEKQEQQQRARQAGATIVIRFKLTRKVGFLGLGGEKAANTAITFAWIPPGSFYMGSPPGEEGRMGRPPYNKLADNEIQHKVTLAKGFYMGIYPVTQAQWLAVMGKNPSGFRGDDLPVEKVSWKSCLTFCEQLRKVDGKHYRLPTEAEWEYACRAGTVTPYYFGETISKEQANYNDDYFHGCNKVGCQTTPVGTFPPNAWGLYDMHGNVSEWCQDGAGELYTHESVIDPCSPGDPVGYTRVMRGGSWAWGRAYCRSASRGSMGGGVIFLGCRVCFSLD